MADISREAGAAPEPITASAPPLAGRVAASQRWSQLVFLHWRVESAAVAPILPTGVRPDEFDGSSWVGLIAFALDRASVLGSPPLPYFGDFVEVNVRLYGVDERGRRGVYFVSLEASRLAAVIAARATFSIPYFWSDTRLHRVDDLLRFTSVRHAHEDARTTIVVRPGERPVLADPLADFLTARWALFTTRGGATVYLRNTHEPWRLRTAEVIELDDTLLARAGFPELSDRAPDSVLVGGAVTARFARA